MRDSNRERRGGRERRQPRLEPPPAAGVRSLPAAAATSAWPLLLRVQVVPDVLLSQNLQELEAPKAATASRSVLAGIMSTPATLRRFKVRGTVCSFFVSSGMNGRFGLARHASRPPPAAPGPARPCWRALGGTGQFACDRARFQSLNVHSTSRPILLQFAIEQARFYDKCHVHGTDKTACQVGAGGGVLAEGRGGGAG